MACNVKKYASEVMHVVCVLHNSFAKVPVICSPQLHMQLKTITIVSHIYILLHV